MGGGSVRDQDQDDINDINELGTCASVLHLVGAISELLKLRSQCFGLLESSTSDGGHG